MSTERETFGREVIGPITGEFCLRLWSLGSLLERPAHNAMLFCARGGLRLMTAYERFLSTSGLPSPTLAAPLMVSRVAAIRPVLVRAADEGAMPASAASTLSYEFSRRSCRDVLRAMSGRDVGEAGDACFTPEMATAVLRSPDGAEALSALREQAGLFRRHLALTLDGRPNAILVDTGLFGTTIQLMSDGVPDVDFSCALIARANYRGRGHATPHHGKTFGLGVETDGYSPLRRRSAILRYWHLIESTFEPDLPSVRTFEDRDGVPVSNMEVPGWRHRLDPEPGSVFAGVMAYLGDLPHGDQSIVTADAARAWRKLHRAVVWPDAGHGAALDVGTRSNDFGVDETSTARPWKGPLQSLRGHTMWREGEIARSGGLMRLPLLAAIEAAYGARGLKRALASKLGR